jgi:hypothetical protein
VSTIGATAIVDTPHGPRMATVCEMPVPGSSAR